MKAFKLSLATVLAVGAFASLNATSLEESLKDIEVSGALRYRYDTYREKDSADQGDSQNHKMRAQITAKGYLTDNIATIGTFDYNYYGNADDSGYGSGSSAKTNESFFVREAYLQYEAPDFGTTIALGRQQLNTIWTDADIDGAVGMKAQIFNNSIEGLTLTAFAVDSVNDDPDFIGDGIGDPAQGVFNTTGDWIGGPSLKETIFAKNIYGAAALFDYSEAYGVTGSLWLGYGVDRLTLYAVDLGYSYTFANELTWGIEAQYLGNSVDDFLDRRGVGDGSLFSVVGTLEGWGFDGSLGYIQYGKNDATTVNVLEDMGDIVIAGEEIHNAQGSSLHGDLGENKFGFITLGYTFFDKFRIGADYVYGGTKVTNGLGAGEAGDKQEIVGRLSYQYSKDLEFYGHYSYIEHNRNGLLGDTEYNNIRLQARYNF